MTETPNVKQDYLKEKVRKYQILRKNIEAMKQRHEDELKPLEDLLEKLNLQIMGFMNQLGIRFTKTKYGDPGIYTKMSYHVEDQDAYKNHVITKRDWDLLVWAIRRTAAESYYTVHNAYPPGVTVTKEQKLRVSAPTPTGTRRTPKQTEVITEQEKFDAFK